MHLKINNKKVYYSSLGSGRQILILPGWAHDHTVWQNIQTRLSSDFQVFVLDFPGFGESQVNERIKNLDDYARFLKRVIEELNLKDFILIGHSFGGAVSIKTLSMFPDLEVKKLVLVNASGIRKMHAKKLLSNILFSLPLIRRWHQRHTKDLSENPLKDVFKRIVNENLEGLLDKIVTNTTIVWGANDNVTPVSLAKILVKKIKNSNLVLLKNTGHFPFLDIPEQFCEEIRKTAKDL